MEKKKDFNIFGHILVLAAVLLVGCSATDIQSPIPGNGGTLLIDGAAETEVTVIWSKALDMTGGEELLEYKLVYSETANIETPEKADANGTTAVDWTSGITTGTVSGLTADTEYHFNVVVRDEAGNAASYLPASMETGDGTSPAAGNAGTITVSDVEKSSLHLEWEKGSDGKTPAYALEYKGVYSTSDNISTVSDAETNGTVIFDWAPDVESADAAGLSEATEYFFNVLVRDEAGNVTPYSPVSAETAEGSSPVAGNSGTITVSEVGKTSLHMEWEHGSDSRTPTYALEYKGVYSTSDNISTVSDAETNGTVIFDWTPDIESINVTGLSAGTDYFFNVLVRNSDSNITSYTAVSAETFEPWLLVADSFDNKIRAVTLDGSKSYNIFDSSVLGIATNSMAVDAENGVVYWTDWTEFDNHRIMKGNLDGTGIDVVFEGAEVNQPEFLDLDPDSGILYWVNRFDTSLKRVNTAGTVAETVYTDGDRLDRVSGLELDAASKIVYWSSSAVEAGIFRINTDGSGFAEILTPPDVISPDALAIDAENDTLYWADGAAIRKATTDGTGITDVITSGIYQPYTIHYYEETLYFTDTYDRNLYSFSDTLLELDNDLTVPIDIEIWDKE